MKTIPIIKLLILSLILSYGISGCQVGIGPEEERTPNFIVIFADDMGYGDVGVYGHPTIKTPNLDEMASEGQKWTSFYVAASVCTPSRAGLITGRLPIRNGMCSSRRRVLFPDSKGGLPESEHTIASLLRTAGYATACIGKWHLGHLPSYLPTEHGFDYYFGIPYSNDMDNKIPEDIGYHEGCRNPKPGYFNPPLMRNTEIFERPAEQTTISKRYTEETIRFLEENQETPFFIYLAHSMPHVPLYRSGEFENRSLRGVYGDVIEELDWSVGEILAALKRLELEKNTLVVFTSDNGPWLIFDDHGGSAGLLSGGKGGTYEGGMREPAIFWGPGIVKPQLVMELGATLDLLPTFCSLAEIKLPYDRLYDGYDLSPVLTGTGGSPRSVVYYYRGTEIYALRKGAFKAHYITQGEYGPPAKTVHDPPLLFNLEVDPSEKVDIAESHPEVLLEMQKLLDQHRSTLTAVENQLEK
jgi:arylsulfatase A-like enzyme